MRGVISFCVAIVVLIGGYLCYQKYYIEEPLEKMIQKIPGATIKKLTITMDEVQMEISVPPRFISQFSSLYKQITGRIGGREITIKFTGNPDSALLQAWEEMNFGIQEGISLKQYTVIQKTVHQYTSKHQMKSRLLMDRDWIMVQLKHENHYLHRLIPINKGMPGTKEGVYDQK